MKGRLSMDAAELVKAVVILVLGGFIILKMIEVLSKVS